MHASQQQLLLVGHSALGAVLIFVLVVTGHLDGATGVALIVAALGIGSTGAAALATPGEPGVQSGGMVLSTSGVGAIPASPLQTAPTGLGSIGTAPTS